MTSNVLLLCSFLLCLSLTSAFNIQLPFSFHQNQPSLKNTLLSVRPSQSKKEPHNMVVAINRFRKSRNKTVLEHVTEGELSRWSYTLAEKMAKRFNLTHEKNVPKLKKSLKATRLGLVVGYEGFAHGVQGLELVKVWKQSRQHRAALVRRGFTHVSHGCVSGRKAQKSASFCCVLLASFDKEGVELVKPPTEEGQAEGPGGVTMLEPISA